MAPWSRDAPNFRQCGGNAVLEAEEAAGPCKVLLIHVGVAETGNGIVLVNGSSQKSVMGFENSAMDPSQSGKFRT
ncbi:hypothetical protein GCM10009628_39830 [Paeniglutamicibacter kerguelensis]